jgi:hypothetical protein
MLREGSTTCFFVEEAGHDRKWKVVGFVGDKVTHQKGKGTTTTTLMMHIMLMF